MTEMTPEKYTPETKMTRTANFDIFWPTIKLNWNDAWLGVYWKVSRTVFYKWDLKVYVCPLPCLPIEFSLCRRLRESSP